MSNQLTQEHIDHNTQLLVEASENGDTETVKRLIPVSDPKAQDSWALRWASHCGYMDIVKLLIPVSEPKVRDSEALRWAAKKGHTDIVKLLIPVSEPKADNSYALQQAAYYGYTEIVKLLVPVSDYFTAKQELIDHYSDTTLLQKYIDEHEALLQKERLTHQLNSSVNLTQHSSVKRKI